MQVKFSLIKQRTVQLRALHVERSWLCLWVQVQSDWCSGGLDIVVATVAFGELC
jgi:hypothetical protein